MDPVHFGMVDTLNSAIGININTLMPRIDSMLNIDILRSSLDLVRIPNIDILRSSLDLVRIPNIDILRSSLDLVRIPNIDILRSSLDLVRIPNIDILRSSLDLVRIPNIDILRSSLDLVRIPNIDILRSSLDLVRIPNIDILRSSLDLVRIPNIDILRSNLFPTLIHPKAQEATTLGWIPHYTLPMDLLEDKEGEDLDLAIMDHYRERWPRVRKQLELATDGYLIDEHSKETMKEALEAHESKLYRMVPPTLLVGIEGAVRNHLNKNIVGQGVDVKGRIVTGAGDLPISAARNLSSEMVQYETVENHLYKHVDNEADRADLSENPIPNRHAAIHGLVPYSSEKSSLNSIFLADFVFHVITEIKRQKISEAARILRNHIPTMN